MTDGQRDDVFFFVIERSMTIDELMTLLYVLPTEATREHFLHVNTHVDPNGVRRGQLVVVTPLHPRACTTLEYEFAAMARHVDFERGSDEGADGPAPEIVNRFYDLLSFADGQAAGAVGAYATAYGFRVRQVADTLREIEDLYVRTYNRHGRLNLQEFFNQRRILFRRLDQALGRMVRSRVVDPRYTNMRRALGLSTRSMINTWRRQGRPVSGIPEFHRHYQRVDRLARHLRWLGYVGIGLDGYYSYRQIREACTVDSTDPACRRRVFTETGRFAGSVAGGTFGGAVAAWGVCTIIFALPSGGTSALWCGVVAGGAGAVAGGMAGGLGGEYAGELVYEQTYPMAP